MLWNVWDLRMKDGENKECRYYFIRAYEPPKNNYSNQVFVIIYTLQFNF